MDLEILTVIVVEELPMAVILSDHRARQYFVLLTLSKKTRRLVEAHRNCRGPKVNRPGQPGQYRRAG